MSDIPEAFMTAALEVSVDLEAPEWDDGCNAIHIARALMAADEAATKRERERCVGIVADHILDRKLIDFEFGYSEAAENIKAAILNGEA